jgi:hypothetical protein
VTAAEDARDSVGLKKQYFVKLQSQPESRHNAISRQETFSVEVVHAADQLQAP